jgi:hypothetical protein
MTRAPDRAASQAANESAERSGSMSTGRRVCTPTGNVPIGMSTAQREFIHSKHGWRVRQTRAGHRADHRTTGHARAETITKYGPEPEF